MAEGNTPTTDDLKLESPQLTRATGANALDDSQPVWRYMARWKFEAILQDQALYFNRITTFLKSDPLEGTIPTKQIIADAAFSDAEAFHRFMQMGTIEQTYINCWHLAGEETGCMWEQYASLADGIILESTVGQLRAQFKGGNGCKKGFVERVRYIDHTDDTVPSRNRFATIAIKDRAGFHHEREVRMYFVYDVYYLETVWGSIPDHELLAIEASSLMNGVILAPLAEPDLKSQIQQLLAGSGLGNVAVKASTLV